MVFLDQHSTIIMGDAWTGTLCSVASVDKGRTVRSQAAS